MIISRLSCTQCYKSGTWLIRQVLVAVSCSLSFLMIGNCVIWMEPFAAELMHPKGTMSYNTYSWLIASLEFGDAFTCLGIGYLMDWFGRKTTLLLTGPTCLITWILLAVTRNDYIIFLVRIIQGAIKAVVANVGPVYLVEISSPNIRGALQVNATFIYVLGILFTFCVGNYFSYQQFMYLSMILPIIFTVTYVLMPESPYYYLLKDRKEEAGKVISWLRAKEDVTEEITAIEEHIKQHVKRKTSFKALFATKSDRRGFFIVQIVNTSASLGGLYAFSQYAKETLLKLPLLWFDANQITVVLGIILVISSLPLIFLSDTVGRRRLLIYSSGIVTLAHCIVCIYCFLHEKTSLNVAPQVWITYIGIFIISVVSNFGALHLIGVIQGEFFPAHTRGVGNGVTGFIFAIEQLICLNLYLPIMEIFGVYLVFLCFTIIGVVLTILMILYVPESACKTLEEIQTELSQKCDEGGTSNS